MPKYVLTKDRDIIFPFDTMSLHVKDDEYVTYVVMDVKELGTVTLGDYDSVQEAAKVVIDILMSNDDLVILPGYSNSDDEYGW